MTNNKNIIAFIPARGNSKSIKKKNLALLGSKPLIDYVIEAAKSFNFNKIVCSTEDKEIASYCLNKKIEVSVRDRTLSKDETNVVDVIHDYIKKQKCDDIPELIMLFQPTYPFIKNQHIQDIIKIIVTKQKINSVQTVFKVPHRFHAYNQRFFKNGSIDFYLKKEREKSYNKQKKPPFYVFGNLVVFRTKAFLKQLSCFPVPSNAIEIDEIYSFDIDTSEDLKEANNFIDKLV